MLMLCILLFQNTNHYNPFFFSILKSTALQPHTSTQRLEIPGQSQQLLQHPNLHQSFYWVKEGRETMEERVETVETVEMEEMEEMEEMVD